MIVQAVILGIVQGITEFLPISSSGHLAILEKIFIIKEPVVLAVFLHFGTFLATIVFFFKPLVSIIKGVIRGEKDAIKYVIHIVIGTIPVVVFVVFFKSRIEQTFNDIQLIVLLLGITGMIILLTGIIKKREGKVNIFSAVIIGIAQMFSVFPGLSRSGLTISAGLFSRVNPRAAFQFSFLLSLPAVFGANLLELKNITTIENYTALFVGILCSFGFGLLALKILRDLVHRKFHFFGIYCLVFSIVLLLLQ